LIGNAAAAPFLGRFGPAAADADATVAATNAALPFFLHAASAASAGVLVSAAAGIFEVLASPLLPAPVVSPFWAFAAFELRTHRHARTASYTAAQTHRKMHTCKH
jgi:hypothetical protein